MAESYPAPETSIEESVGNEDEDLGVADNPVLLIMDSFKSIIGMILLSFLIFVILTIHQFFTPGYVNEIFYYFTSWLPPILIVAVAGIGLVSVVLFANKRIISSANRKSDLRKTQNYLDLILTSVVSAVFLVMFTSIIDWASRIIYWLPNYVYGISGLSSPLSLILGVAQAAVFHATILISVVLLYGSVFYRFASRYVAFIDGENEFSLTYIDRSGKSLLFACGLILGYSFVAVDIIQTEIPLILLLVFLLTIALTQRTIAKNTLDRIEKKEAEVVNVRVNRLTEHYSFITKRAYRWLIAIAVFLALANYLSSFYTLALLPTQFLLLPITQLCILGVGFSTLYILIRYTLGSYNLSDSVIGRRPRVESGIDMIITSMGLVLSVIVLIPQINPLDIFVQYNQLVELYQQPFGPMPPIGFAQMMIVSVLSQVWIYLLLVGLAVRFYSVSIETRDARYDREEKAMKFLVRSGKLIVLALASLVSIQLSKGLILSYLDSISVQYLTLATLIVLQIVISQLRLKEIKVSSIGGQSQ